MSEVAYVEGNVQTVVHVQANEVAGAFDLSRVAVEQVEWKLQMAVLDQAEERFVESLVEQGRPSGRA